MPRYVPNGGATDARQTIRPPAGNRRSDHFGAGHEVAGALGKPASGHKNGGRRPLPPVRR